ncbi:hypothetical protein M9434_005606 [Picochlorum sp. BPE23]|nr:hypothetical protein M9434_005606 [Picochlorum sp. BPE23]
MSQDGEQHPGNPLPDAPEGLVVESTVSQNIFIDTIYVSKSSYSRVSSDEVVETALEGEGEGTASWLSHRGMGGGVAVNAVGDDSFPVSWTCDGSANEVVVHVQRNCTRRIQFDVAVFSQCGCLVDGRGDVLVAVLTVDKYLHLITLGSSVDVSSQYFEANDVPVTDLVLMDNVVCIGKQSGSITCVDIQRGKFTGHVWHLGQPSGLLGNFMGSYLGSFFGGGSAGSSNNTNGIACMDVVSVQTDDGEYTLLLCCLYCDASLRVWDVQSKHMLHEVALLPPHEAVQVIPSCLTHSEDILHHGGYFLIASFEVIGGEESKSHLCLFEMTIQDRKHGVLNIHVDTGPRLTGVKGRVSSASLEYVGSGYHVWFVSQGESGSMMQRISFEGEADGRHTGVKYAIRSTEERLRDLGGSSDLDREMLKMYFDAVGSLLKQGHLINYVLDDVFLPFNVSAAAMKATLQVLGVEYDGQHDIRSCLTSWILDGDSMDPFSRCLRFLDVYLVEYHRQCCPLAIRVIQRHDVEQKAVIVVRRDGKISYLFDADPFESIRHHARMSDSEADLVAEFYAVMNVFTSSAAVSMALYALRQGVNLKEELLPALVKVATGHVRIDAVEFGRKALPVRKVLRNFPVVLNDWEQDLIGPVVDHVIQEFKCGVVGEEYEDESLQDNKDAMHSSVHSWASARLDLLIKLGVALEYFSGNTSLWQLDLSHSSKRLDTIFAQCFSVLYVHWACMQNVCLQKQVQVPVVRAEEDVLMEEPFSKRAKRESDEEEIYGYEIILGFMSAPSEVRNILDMCSLQNTLLDRLGQGNIHLPAALMHSILRNARIVNQDDITESLMHIFNATPFLGGFEMKVFKAFLQLKMCHRVKDSYARNLQEQEALSILLSSDLVCSDFSENSKRLSESLESVCRWIGVSWDTFDALSQEDYLDLVGEILERLGCNESFKNVTLLSARLYERSESSEGVGKSVRAWGKLYSILKEEGHLQEAYVAALSMLDPQRQIDCIRNLVDHYGSTNALISLCTLPLLELRDFGNINVFDQISHALWDKALKEPIDESKAYLALYDFYVSRGNFQSAAAAVLSHCRRMVKESAHSSLEIALSLQKMLTLAEGCLKMVDTADAWLEDSNPLDQETFVREFVSDDAVATTEYTIPQMIDIRSVQKELASIKALVHIASIVPNYEMNKNEKEIFSQLLSLSLYDEAWHLAQNVFSWSDIQEAREKIVFHLSKNATLSGSRGHWRRLKSFINDTGVSDAIQDKMRLAAVEAILMSDTSMGIPPWILEPYLCQYEFLSGKSTPKGKMNDSIGMIRLLLQYGKLELAAKLALELLSPVTTSASSIALPKVGSINLPHDVLSQLLSLLEGEASRYPSLKSLHGVISTALDSANASAAKQTGALQNILST